MNKISQKKFLIVVAVFLLVIGLKLIIWPIQVQESVVHQISANSEVKMLDNEWSVYENRYLGIEVKFPTKALEDSPTTMETDKDAIIPVKVIENGEIVTFSRGYMVDRGGGGKSYERVAEDLSVRKPYYAHEYLDDLSYPYQVYMAKINNADELGDFVRRVYGEGCALDGPSTYQDKPGIEYFAIGGDESNCQGFYPIGDVVSWNAVKGSAFGIQPGGFGHFYVPNLENLIERDLYYELEVGWVL